VGDRVSAAETLPRVALVTGGARGLGRGAADRLAADGARVIVLDVAEPVDAAWTDLAALSPDDPLSFVRVDVTDGSAVRRAVDAVVAVHGGIDVLVVGAGIAIPATRLVDAAWDDVARLVDVNVWGVMRTLRAVLAVMRAGGSVVVISSQTGKQAWEGWGVYSGSKAFSIALVQALAVEHAEEGIRVNALCPGTMESDMMRTAFTARAAETGRSLDEEIAAYAARIPAGRMGTPTDVGGAVAWLASPDSSFVTGATINLTGGEMTFF